MTLRKIAILQARMSSSRLPGKVLIEVAGKSILQQMLERVQQSRLLDGILVATTTDPSDDVLEQFCHDHDLPCFRGSMPDVLDRYYQAATQINADVVVRLTADCPLMDADVLDLTIQAFLGWSPHKVPAISSQSDNPTSLNGFPCDFATNRLPPPWKRSLPIGLDVEVCSFDALQSAWQEAHEPYQLEHVMPYLYEGVEFSETTPMGGSEWSVQHGITPHGFRIALLNHTPDFGSLRWTVDTPEDLEFIREVILRLGNVQTYSWKDVLSLLDREPGLAQINADVKHKSAFDVDERHRAGGSR